MVLGQDRSGRARGPLAAGAQTRPVRQECNRQSCTEHISHAQVTATPVPPDAGLFTARGGHHAPRMPRTERTQSQISSAKHSGARPKSGTANDDRQEIGVDLANRFATRNELGSSFTEV